MSDVTIGDNRLLTNFMNAACSVAKTPEDIAALCATQAGAVVIGSITVQARQGNPEPRWYDDGDYALNSFGMPNGGIEYYREALLSMTASIHSVGKVSILSIAGFIEDDYAQLATLANDSGVNLLELNLGCPNVRIDGLQKPIASFDVEYMTRILKVVTDSTSLPLLIKLSPYSNPAELQRVATLIADTPQIVAVVTANTFANGFAYNGGVPALYSELGGVSGKALKPIALGQVRQFRNLLPESVAVIGVGGIESASDVNDYIMAGATAVQVATLIVREGHEALDRLTA